MKVTYKLWHELLNMERHDEPWHVNDVADEYQELLEARGWVNRWSEYSDVVYTVTRGRWGGHDIESPLARWQFIYGSVYMFPKMTSRYLFFRRAGKRAGAGRVMREIRNPKKVHKLEKLAKLYEVEPEVFVGICERQLKYWPLLK